ncbi:MAG: aldo/keto reductase, partial [Muribaculaceae bacterium]|nr:aldo/keto reductase [Muribaculaceae bacterium]
MSNIIDRREFLKRLGIGSTLTGLAIAGCKNTEKAVTTLSEGKEGEMTYRKNPKTGEKVSILGYGCMRWPTKPVEGGGEGDEEIDQEMVNRLVDTALEHGVNYFDTSPAYCRGKSEGATGTALCRHPRDSYYIATKLSNFAPQTFSREASIDMYHNSMKELKTDYIDYLLLHGVGMGGMENLHARYLDNGVLD